jgi:hypothetical protein
MLPVKLEGISQHVTGPYAASENDIISGEQCVVYNNTDYVEEV